MWLTIKSDSQLRVDYIFSFLYIIERYFSEA